MRKYLNSVDYIVFGVSIICLFWIAFYKLSWLNLEPLFVNADKWADITYTVFTSIFAAGIFYIVSIFAPKIPQIKNMRKRIFNYMDEYDTLSGLILSRIINSNTKIAYELDEYLEILNRNDFNSDDFRRLNKDFNIAFATGDYAKDIAKIISFQRYYLNNIVLIYRDILPNDVFEEISDLCNLMYKTLESNINTKLESQSKGHFNILNQLILTGGFIKFHKVLKK